MHRLEYGQKLLAVSDICPDLPGLFVESWADQALPLFGGVILERFQYPSQGRVIQEILVYRCPRALGLEPLLVFGYSGGTATSDLRLSYLRLSTVILPEFQSESWPEVTPPVASQNSLAFVNFGEDGLGQIASYMAKIRGNEAQEVNIVATYLRNGHLLLQEVPRRLELNSVTRRFFQAAVLRQRPPQGLTELLNAS